MSHAPGQSTPLLSPSSLPRHLLSPRHAVKHCLILPPSYATGCLSLPHRRCLSPGRHRSHQGDLESRGLRDVNLLSSYGEKSRAGVREIEGACQIFHQSSHAIIAVDTGYRTSHNYSWEIYPKFFGIIFPNLECVKSRMTDFCRNRGGRD
jgi:hypothetical protein